MYAINTKTLAYKGQLHGRLKISVVSTGKYVMPFFLSNFMREHSSIELLMDVTNKIKVIESLEKNEVDFALVSILPKNINVEKLDLLSNKLFLIGNSKSVLPKGLSSKEIFNDLPLIFREEGSGTRQTMEKFIERNSYSINKKIELTSNEAVKQALLAGLGYSIMPVIGIKNELQNNELIIVPMKGLPIKTTWSLIWLKGKKHAPAPSQFLEYLKKEKNKIIEENFKFYDQF